MRAAGKTEEPTDLAIERLTASLARHSEDAWRDFHRLYFARLHRYLVVVLDGDEHAAADCVQETFLRVVRNIRRFDSQSVFWCWLACLARCAAIDHQRARKRHVALLERFAHWREWRKSGADPAPQHRAAVEDCLRSLSPEEREMISKKYLSSHSYADLAAEYGLTVKAVESKLSRLRAKIRRRMMRSRYVL